MFCYLLIDIGLDVVTKNRSVEMTSLDGATSIVFPPFLISQTNNSKTIVVKLSKLLIEDERSRESNPETLSPNPYVSWLQNSARVDKPGFGAQMSKPGCSG